MFKWFVLAMAILAVALFFNDKDNRTVFLALAKRVWKAVVVSALVVALLIIYSQINQ